jgi:DNA-binding NtrC family response regulator
MKWLRGETPDSSFERLRAAYRASSLKTRLMLGLIPPVICIILLAGYFSYQVSKQSIGSAVQRATRLQALAARNAIEAYLDRFREDISYLAQEPITPSALHRFLAKSKISGGLEYLHAAVISPSDADHLAYLAKDEEIVPIPAGAIRPNPLSYFEPLKSLEPLQVWLSPVMEVELPAPEPDRPNLRLIRKVIQMAIACRRGDGAAAGFLIVAADARQLRNILSLHNSTHSPMHAYPRTPEERYFYLFDTDGWILFHSDALDRPLAELSTHMARSGLTGTLGREGLEFAFRPDAAFEAFWEMVANVRQGRQDIAAAPSWQPNAFGRTFQLAYAPVRFRASREAPPRVVAGVAYFDITRLPLAAGAKQIDLMLYVTAAAALLVGGVIYALGRIITRPILKLAEAVDEFRLHPELKPIALPYAGREITVLQRSINAMIAALMRQLEEIREKDQTIRSANLKEEAVLDGWLGVLPGDGTEDPVPAIVGQGARIERLKTEILKAAQVDADVLVVGETGTGKQLAAEAIHRLSRRAGEAFLSINCGALDENLLLDTLFGHVRGAFTEAQADRKGAFLEADRGTLFLDEIQAAAPRVQQALLRAVAARKIKPLGSDREIEVDVRLIAATNADLREMIRRGAFREDLYFRLKVITIHTLPLREQKENIPLLARHFLGLQGKLAGRPGVGLSRGALAKLTHYDWPGNVRELENCITRAVVMSESPVIQADEILLDVEGWEAAAGEGRAAPGAGAPPPRRSGEIPPALNRRQRLVFDHIRANGRITRSEYQEIVGGGLPARTAIYDLQDLVAKGILVKAGSGPATHYCLAAAAAPEKS